jgi:ankyrin repeat protein
VLQRLIDLNVDVCIRNNKRKTPLFYASRNGDLKAIEMLMKAGASQNDGSLHEAAREAHPDVVSMLLDNGHDPDYPSELHFGRSALAETCLNAKPSGQSWESRVQRVMQFLLKSGTDLTEKHDGKTLLHLALDNDCALDVTRTLLEFPQIWKRINEDFFLYQDSRHICYSPTKYVEEFYIGAEHGMRETLVQLLKTKRCKDRLFSDKGEQIQGAIGLPEDLEVMERRQTLANEEHARSMQRMKEMAALQIELSNKALDNSLRQAQRQEEYEIESGQRRNEKQIAWDTAKGRRRLQIAREEHEQDLQNKAAAAIQEREIMTTNRAASLDHMKKVARIEKSSAEAKVEVQSKLLDRQDQSFKERAKEMKSVAEACKNTGLNQNSLKLLGDGHSDWRRDID